MLAEFARQIEEEKRAKELEMQSKVAAYQEMLKGNAKELERKKAIKEADRQENLRLFELQIEMADKQVWSSAVLHFVPQESPLRHFLTRPKFNRSVCELSVRRNDS